MSRKQLIVNADGFGFTYGNNRTIMEVLEHGFIRSVSVNVTWPAVEEVAALARNFPHVSIGVHLNLCVGPSVLPPKEIPSLVAENGEFDDAHFVRMARKRLLNMEEMRRELRAQIHRLRDLGVTITHWDSHRGRHLYPGFLQAAMAVAAEEGIRASRTHLYHLIFPPGHRMLRLAGYYARNPGHMITHSLCASRMRALRRAGVFLPDRRLVLASLGPEAVYTPACWQRLFQAMPDGLGFIECHPGYVDDTLRKYAKLCESRERERELFADPDWLARAGDAGVEVVSYYQVLAGASGEPADTRWRT